MKNIIVTQTNCSCNPNSLSLKRDDYKSRHRPAAIRISNNGFIENDKIVFNLRKRNKLVDVYENEGFGIANLTQSSPILIPLAQKRLYELGKRFKEGLGDEDKNSYFVISSITRTEHQQHDVRRTHSMAATKGTSTHSYGVSFDINTVVGDNGYCERRTQVLKKILTEMQKEGKILLCPESKCIHVTVCG